MKFLKPNQQICCNDVIQCIFDLNKLDIEVYKLLKKNKELRAQTLSQYLNKERSTVYRSLQKLTNTGLCNKKTKNIPSGGYYHIYSCNKLSKIQKNLEVCIDDWYKKMKNTIKELNK